MLNGEIDRPVGVSDCTVNLSNGRGELLCRTGDGKVRTCCAQLAMGK